MIDIAPTVLEATGLPEPRSVNGTAQTPIEGVSMLYTFDDAQARDRHTTQYFEILPTGRCTTTAGWPVRFIARRGKANQRRRSRVIPGNCTDTRNDFSLRTDLAPENAGKLKELQALFMKEAVKFHVLPLDDRGDERVNPELAGRPDLMGGRTSLDLFEGMKGMTENTFINVKNRSHTITAEVEIPGWWSGGYSLPGRAFRRLEPLPDRRQAGVHLQLPGTASRHGRGSRSAAAWKGKDSFRIRG